MKPIFKTLLLTTFVTVVFFTTATISTSNSSFESTDFKFVPPPPEQVNLSDPKEVEYYTKKIETNVMPLINARAGQEYLLTEIEDLWNETPGRQGQSKYNASVKGLLFPDNLPSVEVTIKMKYHVSAGLPSKPIYGLDSYNVTKIPVTERDLGPEQIDLGDPKVRERETKVVKNEVMPLVNAAAGQNYSLQSLEEMWNLTPYSAGGNQLNASVKASPNQLPTQNVNIKIVYSEIFPGPPWGLVYKLESYNVTKK